MNSGLVTYADEPKSWLRAGSGQSQFHQFRDRLLNIEPLPTTADYEALFGEIRVRLRRRAYLVLLADLTERSVSDSLRRGVAPGPLLPCPLNDEYLAGTRPPGIFAR